MRKYVVFIALLSLLTGFTQCDSASIPTKAEKKEKPSTRISKKKNQTANDKAEADFESDSLNSDSTWAEAPTPLDSLAAALPDKNDFEDVDQELATDSLEQDYEEVTEEWVDEDDIDYDQGEFEDEYVESPEGDVRLKMERILKTEIVNVRTPQVRDEMDSTLAIIEERMSLNPEEPSKRVVVEKWYSPVNYRGYKFNRKKLLLYGVDKAEPVQVYFYLGEYYFAFNMRLYNLNETSKNLAFVSVKDSVLVNYLLDYDY